MRNRSVSPPYVPNYVLPFTPDNPIYLTIPFDTGRRLSEGCDFPSFGVPVQRDNPSQNVAAGEVRDPILRSRESGVRRNLGSGGEPEHVHLIGVLSFDDEFREDVGCGGIQEKFRHALAQGIGHDQL